MKSMLASMAVVLTFCAAPAAEWWFLRSRSTIVERNSWRRHFPLLIWCFR
jgi:hypothetical protein